jgi:hypothetical protein
LLLFSVRRASHTLLLHLCARSLAPALTGTSAQSRQRRVLHLLHPSVEPSLAFHFVPARPPHPSKPSLLA